MQASMANGNPYAPMLLEFKQRYVKELQKCFYCSSADDYYDALMYLSISLSYFYLYKQFRLLENDQTASLKLEKVEKFLLSVVRTLNARATEIRAERFDMTPLQRNSSSFVPFLGSESKSNTRFEQLERVRLKLTAGSPGCLKYCFAQIAGLQNAKSKIENSYVNALLYRNLFGTFAKGLLFYGLPGTGKTILAASTVNEIQKQTYGTVHVEFFAPSISDMKSSYVGETEKRIARLFQETSEYVCMIEEQIQLPVLAILFLDEVDAIARSRQLGGSTSTVNALLQAMDGIKSFQNISVIAATNYPWEIDLAVIRRFETQVYIELPSYTTVLQYLVQQFDDLVTESYEYLKNKKKIRSNATKKSDKGCTAAETKKCNTPNTTYMFVNNATLFDEWWKEHFMSHVAFTSVTPAKLRETANMLSQPDNMNLSKKSGMADVARFFGAARRRGALEVLQNGLFVEIAYKLPIIKEPAVSGVPYLLGTTGFPMESYFVTFDRIPRYPETTPKIQRDWWDNWSDIVTTKGNGKVKYKYLFPRDTFSHPKKFTLTVLHSSLKGVSPLRYQFESFHNKTLPFLALMPPTYPLQNVSVGQCVNVFVDDRDENISLCYHFVFAAGKEIMQMLYMCPVSYLQFAMNFTLMGETSRKSILFKALFEKKTQRAAFYGDVTVGDDIYTPEQEKSTFGARWCYICVSDMTSPFDVKCAEKKDKGLFVQYPSFSTYFTSTLFSYLERNPEHVIIPPFGTDIIKSFFNSDPDREVSGENITINDVSYHTPKEMFDFSTENIHNFALTDEILDTVLTDHTTAYHPEDERKMMQYKYSS